MIQYLNPVIIDDDRWWSAHKTKAGDPATLFDHSNIFETSWQDQERLCLDNQRAKQVLWQQVIVLWLGVKRASWNGFKFSSLSNTRLDEGCYYTVCKWACPCLFWFFLAYWRSNKSHFHRLQFSQLKVVYFPSLCFQLKLGIFRCCASCLSASSTCPCHSPFCETLRRFTAVYVVSVTGARAGARSHSQWVRYETVVLVGKQSCAWNRRWEKSLMWDSKKTGAVWEDKKKSSAPWPLWYF